MKGLGAAGHETDGGFQAGQGHRGGQNQLTGPAKIVVGDVRQSNAAVGAQGISAPALGTHPGDEGVNQSHKQTAEHTGQAGPLGNVLRAAQAQLPQDLDDGDAEGQSCQGIHGVVALQKAR